MVKAVPLESREPGTGPAGAPGADGTDSTVPGPQGTPGPAGPSNPSATTLNGVPATGFIRSDEADVKTSGNLRFNDNIKLTLGSSNDAELYVDGNHCPRSGKQYR